MRYITIGFSRPKKWKIGAELIQWYTNVSFSHAYIRYIDDQNRDVVFEAANGSVHPVLFENFTKDNVAVEEYSIEFSEEEYNKLRDFYYNLMGQLYAYLDLLLIIVYETAQKIGLPIKNQSIPGYICSQLASEALKDIKGFVFDKELNLMKPNDLRDYLLNKGYKNGIN